MKRAFRNRTYRNPVQKSENENKQVPFFSKDARTPFFNHVVQTKLSIGAPNDKYEKEADNMADAVVNSSTAPEIQNKGISKIQKESNSSPTEEEKVDSSEQNKEDDQMVQQKSNLDQTKTEEEENELGAVQTKKSNNKASSNKNLGQTLSSKAGKGNRLSKNTRLEMERSFGRDFNDVNIHTDNEAINMNKGLGAQAFTLGKDIYFNKGKYDPNTVEGKRLLVHELTHVIQQNMMPNKKIQPSLLGEFCEEDPDINNSRVQEYIDAALRDAGTTHGIPDTISAFSLLRSQRERDCCNYDLAAAEQYMYARSEVGNLRTSPGTMRILVLGYGALKLIDMVRSGDCPTTRTSFSQVGWGLDGVSAGVMDRIRAGHGSGDRQADCAANCLEGPEWSRGLCVRECRN